MGAEGERLVRLSRRAHVAKGLKRHPGVRAEQLMSEIDELVARLYAVSADELALLQAFLERRLGTR
jgi:hypothetical protein